MTLPSPAWGDLLDQLEMDALAMLTDEPRESLARISDPLALEAEVVAVGVTLGAVLHPEVAHRLGPHGLQRGLGRIRLVEGVGGRQVADVHLHGTGLRVALLRLLGLAHLDLLGRLGPVANRLSSTVARGAK